MKEERRGLCAPGINFDKNFAKFNFTNHARYPIGNSGWIDKYMYTQHAKKLSPMTYIHVIGENYLLVMISAYIDITIL